MTDKNGVERADFICSRLTGHLLQLGIEAEANDADRWVALDLPLLDRVSGWTDVIAGPAVTGHDQMPMVFRFCPEVMARTTASLPLLPDGTGDIRSVATYCDLVEHVVDLEATRWNDVPDGIDRRNQAEHDLYTVHPDALLFISVVQAAALDRS